MVPAVSYTGVATRFSRWSPMQLCGHEFHLSTTFAIN